MNEVDAQPSLISESAEGLVDLTTPTAGSMLREARVSAGAHLESIAFSLKVPVNKIDALERDDVTAFPDTAFMRALAASVCRILRVDPAPVLALMPQHRPDTLSSQNQSARPTFRHSAAAARSSAWFGRSSRWLMVAVIVLLLGAAAMVFVPQGWKPADIFGVADAPISGSGSGSGSGSDVASLNDTEPGSGSATQHVALSVTSPGSADAPPPPTAQSATVSASETQASAKSADLQVAAAPALAPDRLALSARGESWVKVSDSEGKTLLERILKKGDTVSLNDAGRLAVVIGRADVVDVKVGAESRDLSAVARNNVARFEVPE